MLKKIVLSVSMFAFSVNAFAYDAKSCQIKKAKLTEQLQYAKKYNNTNRINGLKHALANLEQKCAQYIQK